MAQVEFTEQFSIAYTTGTAFYIQLQTVPGVYVIKGLTCYSTSGIAPSGAASLSIISSTNTSGGNLRYLFTTTDTVAANVIIPVFSPLKQVVVVQPYIGFLAVGSAGNMVIQVTYSFIPTTNVLSSNFGNEYRTILNTTGATFTGTSATVPNMIKSIIIVNPTNAGAVTVTPLLTTATTTNLAFDSSTVLAEGESYVYTLPLAITSAETISIQSVGASSVNVLYSYTQDL